MRDGQKAACYLLLRAGSRCVNAKQQAESIVLLFRFGIGGYNLGDLIRGTWAGLLPAV
jgi:hypothetical protein